MIKLNPSRYPGRILFQNHPICSNLTPQRAEYRHFEPTASTFVITDGKNVYSADRFKIHFIYDIASQL